MVNIVKNKDGILLNKIDSVAIDKIQFLNVVSLIIWLSSPLIILFFEIINISTYAYHGLLSTLLYLSGCIGVICGGIYIYKYVKSSKMRHDEVIDALQPMWFLLILGLWCIICTVFSEEKRVAIYGYEMLRDNLITFFFYGGFVLSGFAIFGNKKYTRLIFAFFLMVALIISFVSFVDIDISKVIFEETQKSSDLESTVNGNEYFGEYIFLAYIISLASCFIVEKRERIICALLSAVYAIALLKSMEVFFLLLILISYIVLSAYFIKGKDFLAIKLLSKLFLMFIILVALGIFMLNMDANALFDMLRVCICEKKSKWDNAVAFIELVPMTGVGPQNTITVANSMILQICMYLGVPGGLLFTVAFAAQSIYDSKYDRQKVLINFVLMLFFVALSISTTIYSVLAYLFILLGVSTKIKLIFRKSYSFC